MTFLPLKSDQKKKESNKKIYEQALEEKHRLSRMVKEKVIFLQWFTVTLVGSFLFQNYGS